MALWLASSLLVIVILVLSRKKIYSEWQAIRSEGRSWFGGMWKEWGEPFLIAAVIAIVVRTYVVGPYKIPTGSMRTTLIEKDRIFVDKITYRFRPPKRGEIVVFKYPLEPKKDYVKRLVAFGGEEVEIKDGAVYINGERLDDLPEISGHYYYNRNDWSYGKE